MARVNYPSKLGSPTQDAVTDYVTFTTVEPLKNFSAKKLDLIQYNQGYNYKPIEIYPGVSSAVLYMPQKVTESYQQGWSNTNLEYEVARAARGSVGNALDFAGDLGKKFLEKTVLKNVITNLGKISSANLSESAVLSASSGIIYNPMAEVIYDGPEFRRFNYSFTLFASSEEDAKNIFKIVNFLRYASVPSYSSSNLNLGRLADVLSTANAIATPENLLNVVKGAAQLRGGRAGAVAGGQNNSQGAQDLFNGAAGLLGGLTPEFFTAAGLLFNGDNRFITQPPLIQIKYMRGSKLHPYILSPKPCVITSLDIDFTPSGSYTILNNYGQKEVATVVATNVSLSLTEVRTIYREDFKYLQSGETFKAEGENLFERPNNLNPKSGIDILNRLGDLNANPPTGQF